MLNGISEPQQLAWWGLTDPGPFRKANEDAFLALTFDDNEVRLLGKEGVEPIATGDWIFAVSDGMGGANAGEFASRTAVQRITERFPRHYRREGPDALERRQRLLVELFEEIHSGMQEMGRHYEECRGMGATLSLLWISLDQAVFCHVGDSRIYHFTAAGEQEQVTQDHTHVGWLRRQGHINERQARTHPRKHLLQMTLGGQDPSIDPQVGAQVVAPGDRFVLCTDGLIDGLWDHTLHKLLLHPVPSLAHLQPAERLLRESLEVSGRDNTTVLVLQFS
jgi:serine/threonine protein phosphatase PrpC